MGNSGAHIESGVTSVSAADQTIIVAGGATAPTVRARLGTSAGTVAAGDDSRFGKINNVAVSGTPTAGQVPIADGSTTAHWGTPVGGGGGSGDVVGPASATSGHVALFDGTTGKLLKDAGAPPLQLGTTSTTAMPGDTQIPSQPSDIGAQPAGNYQPAGSYATSTQGAKADTALQPATGIVVVTHGANAATTRPAGAAAVYWIGTVPPTNAQAGDLGYGW